MIKMTARKYSLLLLTCIPAISLAHHSVTAHFDMSKSIEIRGTVVDFNMRSPHTSVIIDGVAYIDGVEQSGGVQRWEVESSASSGLRRMGLESDTFTSGDIITVVAAPNRQENFRFVNSSTFISGDGTVYSRSGVTPYAKANVDDLPSEGFERIAGLWMSPGAFGQAESPLPLNAAGQSAWQNYDAKLSPANTCEAMSIPGIFNAPYLFRVEINANEVTLHNQPWEVIRTFELNSEPTSTEPGNAFGIISGSLEGATVVLESQGYPASLWGLGAATQRNGSGADVPSSTGKRVTERFSVSEDGQTLIYEYTVEDPGFLSAPYSDRLEFSRVGDDTPMYAYDCELESASMFSRAPGDQLLSPGN